LFFIWKVFASNHFESEFFFHEIVFVLTCEDHDLAVWKVAESLLLNNFEKKVKYLFTLVVLVLWNLVSDNSSKSVYLSYCLAICGAS
jgi:hypothetical protein